MILSQVFMLARECAAVVLNGENCSMVQKPLVL